MEPKPPPPLDYATPAPRRGRPDLMRHLALAIGTALVLGGFGTIIEGRSRDTGPWLMAIGGLFVGFWLSARFWPGE